MIEASRSVLNRYIPDIYLYSDVYKGEESGKYVVLSSLFIGMQSFKALQITRLRVKPACGVDDGSYALLRGCFKTWSTPRRYCPLSFQVPSGGDPERGMRRQATSSAGVAHDGPGKRRRREVQNGRTDDSNVSSCILFCDARKILTFRFPVESSFCET